MRTKSFLGEFEQMVLLAVLQLKGEAHAPDITRELEASAENGRLPSEGRSGCCSRIESATSLVFMQVPLLRSGKLERT